MLNQTIFELLGKPETPSDFLGLLTLGKDYTVGTLDCEPGFLHGSSSTIPLSS